MKILLQFLSSTYDLSKDYLSANPGIVGVLLGFVLSQVTTYIKERRAAKKLARAVRKLIELEIDHNLTLLSILSREVSFANENNDSFMQSVSFPTWQYRSFESNLSALPGALSEDSLFKVLKFYRELDKLVNIYSEMKILKKQRDIAINDFNEAELSGDAMRSAINLTFGSKNIATLDDNYSKRLTKFEQLIEEIQLEENPLSSSSRAAIGKIIKSTFVKQKNCDEASV